VDRRRTILLVDDDTDFVRSIRVLLESDGYDVSCAFSASECRLELEEKKPDLILLDVMMERFVAGLSLADELRSDREFKSIPIVMMSAVRQEAGLDVGASSGGGFLAADAFLDKPVPPNVLLATVKRLLESSGSSGSGRR